MDYSVRKWQCGNCEEITLETGLLVAPNPFDADSEVWGCPSCKCVGDFSLICDEPGCKRGVTCGFPTPKGYRNTCGEHKED